MGGRGVAMTFLELALMCVALGLVLLIGRSVLPGLLLRVRPSMLRCWFLESDREAEVLGASPALEDCLQRLKAQRFFLLGVKVEKLPLWGRQEREVALAARDQSAFASIVLQPFGAPASVYLYTPLKNEGMVFTRDYAGGAQAERERLSVRNVPTGDLERLVSDHRTRVEAMLERGEAVDLRTTRTGRLDATRTYYSSEYFRRAATPALIPGLVALSLSVVLLLWAILAPFLG